MAHRALHITEVMIEPVLKRSGARCLTRHPCFVIPGQKPSQVPFSDVSRRVTRGLQQLRKRGCGNRQTAPCHIGKMTADIETKRKLSCQQAGEEGCAYRRPRKKQGKTMD